MKKLMLFVLAALLSFAAANAQGTATVVVADSTATNSYVPVFGNWADAYLRCQVIYPESMMAELVGSEIQGVTYYISNQSGVAWTGTFDVRIGTTTNATFDAAWADTSSLVTVYTGTLDGTGSEMTINFSTPFTYTGGNLLIETNQRVKGNYTSCSFYGINSTGSSMSNYNSSAWASIAVSQRNFIPKTGFIVSVSCVPPTFSPITPAATTASVDWTEPGTASAWQLKLNDADWFDVTEHPYTITGLTPETAYTLQLRSNCGGGDLSYPVSTSFTTPPTCPAPTELTATSTENSLTLSWMENGSATEWLMKVNDGAYQTVTNPYTLTGLTANTLYAIEVRAYCGADDTSTAVSGSFRTPCGMGSLPYNENFEAYTAGSTSFPNCWTSSTGTNYVQSNYGYNSEKALHMQGPGTVVTPIISIAGQNVYINFDLKKEGSSSGTMAVGFATSPEAIESAIYFDTISPEDNNYHNYEFELNNTLNIQSGCLVFQQISTSSGWYYWIDNLNVMVLTDCRRPASGQIANVTPVSAGVSWEVATEATAYELAYGTTNDVEQADTVITVNGTTKTLTDLAPETAYYVWVRTVCGAERTLWREIGSFTTQMACAPVADATVTATTFTAIALSWAIDTEVGYPSTGVVVSYKASDATDWTEVTTTNNYIMLTGLEEGTSYNVKIQNVCGTDSATVVTKTASTKVCGEVAGGTTTTSYVPTYTYYNYSYTQAVYTDAEIGQIGEITGISFKRSNSNSATRTVDVYMADVENASLTSGPIDISNFVQVASDYTWSISSEWNEIVFDVPFVHQPGHDIVVALDDNTGSYVSAPYFSAHSGSSYYFYQDNGNISPENPSASYSNLISSVPDIRFTTECNTTCEAPLAVVGNVTIHEVAVNWTAMGTEASWTVAHRLSGEEEWIVDNNNVTANTYTFTGLNAASTYQIRVGANCDSDTAYAIVNAVTECDVIAMPYTNGFETYTAGTSSFPQCWTNVSQTSNYVQSGSSYASAGSNGLHMQGPATVATPIIAFDGNDIYVRCDMKRESADYSGDMAIGIAASASAEDIAAAIYFDTITAVPTSSFNTYELTYENTTNIQNGCIVFKQVNTTSTNYYYWLDELVISEPPTCARPTDLTATATENSLTLSWTENGTATQWLLKVDTNAWQLVTTNPYTLNGLNANTQYAITIAALCNGTDTSETSSGTFRTNCSTESLPYFEGFENGIDCWSQQQINGTTTWNFSNTSYSAIEGSSFVSYRGSTRGHESRLISPVINMEGVENAMLVFAHAQKKWGSDQDTLKVEYRLNNSDTWHELVTYSEDITTFRYDTIALTQVSSTFQLAFHGRIQYGYGVVIDDLSIMVPSDCQRPDSGLVTNITPVSATASWAVSELATAYEIAYGTSGSVNNADTILSTANTTINLADLEPNTTYYIWVRTVCGTERTLWLPLGSFSTQPACAQVVGATVRNAGITSLTVGWSINDTVGYLSTAVQVSYKKSGVTTWTDTVVTGNLLTLENLVPGSTYNIRVYNICSDDTASYASINGTTQVACAQVVNAHVLAAAMTAVSIGWDIDEEVGYSSTAVKVSYKEASAPNTAWVDTVVTTNYFILTGLESATTYNFRIRNICGTDTANYATLNAATSACGEVGDGSTTASYIPTYTLYNYAYTQAIYTDGEVGSIDTIHGISYYYNGTNNPTRSVDIYIADVPNASLADGYLSIDQFSQVVDSYSWTIANGWNQIAFNQPFVHQSGNDIVIAVNDHTGSWVSSSNFKAHSGNGRYIYQDASAYDPLNPPDGTLITSVADIRFDVTCNVTCPAPMLVVSGVAAHEVSLNWTVLGSETSWKVEYKKLTDTTWTLFNANYTTTTCTINGLDGATDYQFRVAAICGDDLAYATTSATTECAAYAVTATEDYTQDFNATGVPRCWNEQSETTTAAWYNMTGGRNNSRAMYFEGWSAGSAMLISPELDCSTLNLGAQVRYWYKLPSSDDVNATLKLYYRTAADAEWVAIPSATVSDVVSGWTEAEIILPNSENAAYYQIAFEAIADESYNDESYAYLEDVVVEATPTCPRPRDFSLDAVSDESATISWTSDASLFEVRYRTVGGFWNIVNPAPTTSSVQLTGLTTATVYELTVRAICTPGDTSRVATYLFSTECSIITATSLPYLEGFENDITCWTQEMLSGSGEWEVNPDMENDDYDVIAAYEGANFIGMVMDTYDETVTRIISPVFDLSGVENATLKFAHLQPIYAPDQDNLTVEYRLSHNAAWQTLVTYTNDISSWQSESIALPEVSSTFQLAFRARCVYGHGVAIDSVSISAEIPDVPTCDVPTNIATSNLTANTVTVTWTGSAAQYQVEIIGGGQTFTQTVNTNSYTIETLTQETQYTVRVRALCDNGLNSDWSAVVNFTTPQPECGVPTNVQTTTTANSVTITWTGYASEYDVKVTGSEIAPINRTVNTNSCTIEGLVPASTYQVIVRAKCNGQYTDWTAPTTFYTADGQGIDDVQGDFSVSLFPNPAKTSVTLKVDGLNGKANVSLIDMSGRTVMTNTLDGNDELQFNVTTLAKGTYFVRINGETISTVRKLVVQ